MEGRDRGGQRESFTSGFDVHVVRVKDTKVVCHWHIVGARRWKI